MSRAGSRRGFETPPLVVGHRGGCDTPDDPGWPPENTMAAFEHALAQGADGIELDVRPCGSGEIVVFHDPDLTRATAGADRRQVSDVSYAELAAVRLFGGESGPPLLSDVLRLCEARGAALNVEIKHDTPRPDRLVAGVARELSRSGADVVVSSFHPGLLLRLGLRAPRVRRAWLLTSKRRWSRRAALHVARAPWLYALHIERTLASPRLVSVLRDRGLRVGVWTVNDPDEARDLVAIGADWIITDAPGRIRDAVHLPLQREVAGE